MLYLKCLCHKILRPTMRTALLVLAGLSLAPQAAFAAAEPMISTDKEFSLIWALPFVGILLSIAIWPLVRPHFWHKHYGKISAVWALLVLIPMLGYVGWVSTRTALLGLFFHEYMPFIILLLTLFTLSGGVRIYSRANGTPASNCVLLGVGTVLASFVGTTGASMLLIRPMLRANQWRRNRKHIVIFFIFLVSNIGGSLTPLGDPPLFLGFLQGVDFFWTTTHMFLPMVLVSVPLLGIFYLLDHHWFRKEGTPPEIPADAEGLRLEGAINLLLLLVVLGAIIASGIWHEAPHFDLYGVEIHANGLHARRNSARLFCRLFGANWHGNSRAKQLHLGTDTRSRQTFCGNFHHHYARDGNSACGRSGATRLFNLFGQPPRRTHQLRLFLAHRNSLCLFRQRPDLSAVLQCRGRRRRGSDGRACRNSARHFLRGGVFGGDDLYRQRSQPDGAGSRPRVGSADALVLRLYGLGLRLSRASVSADEPDFLCLLGGKACGGGLDESAVFGANCGFWALARARGDFAGRSRFFIPAFL